MELKNKTVSFLGDSITEGSGVEDILNNRYDNILKRKLQLKEVYNYGIGGTRLAHQSVPDEKPRHDLYFCARAYDLNPQSDAIIVFGGTNDYGHGDAPFGEMTDNTPATFCGAVEFLMTFLKETYPNSKIIFMTPIRRCGDEYKSDHPNKKEDARPLKDYVEVIKAKGEMHGICVIDLFNIFTANPNTEADKIKYVPDGLHPNDEGHKLLAECIISAIEKL